MIGKLDALSKYSGEEKHRIQAQFFNEGQLIDLNNNNIREKENVKDVELEGIDVITWQKSTNFGQSYRNRGWKCCLSTIIVKWQDIGEDTEFKSWSHRTSYEISSQKMYQDMWQHVSSVKQVKQIGIVDKLSWSQYQQGNVLLRKQQWTSLENYQNQKSSRQSLLLYINSSKYNTISWHKQPGHQQMLQMPISTRSEDCIVYQDIPLEITVCNFHSNSLKY